MKRKFLILPAVCLSLIFACDNNSDRRSAESEGYVETEGFNEADIPESEEGLLVDTERTSASAMEEDVREFANEAASSSMMEVELANIAQEKAQSQQVKDLAQMIANDHKQANQKLQNIAQQVNLNLPQNLKEDHQEKVQDLQEKSGKEFDQKYVEMMVDLHEKDIEKFEDMRDNIQNQELKNWVESTLPVLRMHLEEAKQLKEQI